MFNLFILAARFKHFRLLCRRFTKDAALVKVADGRTAAWAHGQ